MRFSCRVLILLCCILVCGCAAKLQNGLITLNEFQGILNSNGIELYEFSSYEKLQVEQIWGKHIWQAGIKRLYGENADSQIPELIVFANGDTKNKIDAVGIGMIADGEIAFNSKIELMSLMLEKLFPDWKAANIKKWLSNACSFLPMHAAQLKESGTAKNKTEYMVVKGDKVITLEYQEESRGCGKYLLLVQRKDNLIQDQKETDIISSEWTPDFVGSFPELNVNQPPASDAGGSGCLNPAADFKISGIMLGDKAEKVLGMFGNPVKTEIIEGSPTTEGRKLFVYDGLSLMISEIDNSVIKIDVNKNILSTERGVRIGDEWLKVTGIYGEGYKKYREETDFDTYQYANSDSIDRLWFKVDKGSNAVQEIIMVRQS